jgi:outer membrane protein TolC
MLSMVFHTLRRHRRALAVLVGVWLVAPLGAQPLETAGTLPEDYFPALKTLLDGAMRQSPQIILKELELAQWEARVYVQDAQRYPSLHGDMNYAENQTAISSDSSTRSQDSGLFYDFSLNQPLFQWGAMKNQSEIARIYVTIAEKRYAEMRRSLAVSIRQQYLMLIAKKLFLQAERLTVKIQQADLDLTQDRFQHGTAAEGEVSGKKLALEDISLRVAREEAEFVGLRKAFARLVGLSDIAEDEVPAEIPRPVYSAENTSRLLASLLRDGGKSTFEAQIAQLGIRQADLDYRIAKVRLLPKFNAGVDHAVRNNTTASANTVSQQGIVQDSIAIAGNWNIFDGFATKGAKLEALATKRVRERELQIAADTAVDSAQRLERELALDVREMDQWDVRRTLAAAGVDRVKEEIKLGNLKPTAVDDATVNLYVAEFNRANARAKFLWHWSDFVSLAASDPVVNNLPSHYGREKR